MVADTKTLNQVVSSYVADVRRTMPIDKVYLFGSYAKGMASEWSDIDLCFFSDSFENRRSVDIVTELLALAHDYPDFDIEPHVFPTSELQNDNPFVKEILLTGIEI